MNAFWAVAALMMLASLAFVLVPLSRPRTNAGGSAPQTSLHIHRERLRELDAAHARGDTSEQDYAAARDDIARQVLADAGAPDDDASAGTAANRGALLGAVLLMPALAVLGYLWLGDVGALNEIAAQRAAGNAPGHGVAEMVGRLETRLRVDPQDAAGWALLGRSYGYLRQHDKAVSALSRANDLEPGNAGLMADLAEALMLANGHRIDSRAQALLDAVLTREPEHAKARFLLGLQQGVARAAPGKSAADRGVAALQSGAAVVPPRSELAGIVRNAAPQSPPSGNERAGAPARQGPAADATLRVRVTLAPGLRTTLGPQAVVFVYARAVEGPPMPVAAVRRAARELPLEVILGDAQSVMPGSGLSRHARVVVGARVSVTGNATPAAGDLQGQTGAVEWARAGTVHVEIDHVRP